jgi:hypothetical protein
MTSDAAKRTSTWFQESAFPTDLPSIEVAKKFWSELRHICPITEFHVVDPYILQAGKSERATYAGDVVALLKPVLMDANSVTFIHEKANPEVQDLLAENIALLGSDVAVEFLQGTHMHSRHLIADRARALRMDFSFNQIGKTFGTMSLVEAADDLGAILTELERLVPAKS